MISPGTPAYKAAQNAALVLRNELNVPPGKRIGNQFEIAYKCRLINAQNAWYGTAYDIEFANEHDELMFLMKWL